MIVCQVLGGVIGLAIGLHHSWFMNFWLGGAAATLPGFVVGLAWQLKSSKVYREWIGVVCFLGIIAIALTGFAFGFVLPRVFAEMQKLAALPLLQTEVFDRIDVFDLDGREDIRSFTDATSINAFTRGISDAVGHTPNHPPYSRSWYVVLEGPTHQEFELHLNPRFPHSVIGDFVKKSGNSTWYYGTFESKGLRSWVDKQLIGEDANKLVEVTQ